MRQGLPIGGGAKIPGNPAKNLFFVLANPYPGRRVVYGSATDGGVLYTGKRREDATLVFFLSSLPRRRWMQGKDIEEVF